MFIIPHARYDTLTNNQCTVVNQEECRVVTKPVCKDVSENVCKEELVKRVENQCRTLQKNEVVTQFKAVHHCLTIVLLSVQGGSKDCLHNRAEDSAGEEVPNSA